MTDLDAAGHRKDPLEKMMVKQERDKIMKYLKCRLDMRRDFTALVYTADGMAGEGTRRA